MVMGDDDGRGVLADGQAEDLGNADDAGVHVADVEGFLGENTVPPIERDHYQVFLIESVHFVAQ